MRRENQTITIQEELTSLGNIRNRQIEINPPSSTFPGGPGNILGGTPLPDLNTSIMAGHTLLKVIAGFAFVLMGKAGALFFLQYLPLIVLVVVYGLELGVALIQAFVFSILICIYLNDAISLH